MAGGDAGFELASPTGPGPDFLRGTTGKTTYCTVSLCVSCLEGR